MKCTRGEVGNLNSIKVLSACLVALVAAVAIWVVYLIVRVLGRVALFGLKHGPRIFSLAR